MAGFPGLAWPCQRSVTLGALSCLSTWVLVFESCWGGCLNARRGREEAGAASAASLWVWTRRRRLNFMC